LTSFELTGEYSDEIPADSIDDSNPGNNVNPAGPEQLSPY